MGRSRTHYEVLGVRRSATTIEIRRAHHSLARVLHPDRLLAVRLTPEDRRLAERRIREVNEAWRILGDPARRARYDATLGASPSDEPWSPFPPGTPDDVADWGREDAFAGPWLRADSVRVVDRSSKPVEPFHARVLVAFGLMVLIGVLLVVLLAGSGGSGSPPASATTGRCVRIEQGPSAVVVPCSTPNDGKVVSFVPAASKCPAGTSVRRLDIGDRDLACLERVGTG